MENRALILKYIKTKTLTIGILHYCVANSADHTVHFYTNTEGDLQFLFKKSF